MAKGILVIAVIELRAVGPIKAVKGADWLQRDIFRHFMAGQLPQLTQGARVRDDGRSGIKGEAVRSEEHTSELQSLMRISYAVFCLKKKKKILHHTAHLHYTKTPT